MSLRVMSLRFGSWHLLRARPHSVFAPIHCHPANPVPHRSTQKSVQMGKNKKNAVPDEVHLSLPAHPSAATTPIIDTHTHLLTTFSAYKSRYPSGKYESVWEFVRGMYAGRNVRAIVDVWCEAPVQRAWKEVADSALNPQDRAVKWGGIEYWFVMGMSGRSFLSVWAWVDIGVPAWSVVYWLGVHPCVVLPVSACAMADPSRLFRLDTKPSSTTMRSNDPCTSTLGCPSPSPGLTLSQLGSDGTPPLRRMG